MTHEEVEELVTRRVAKDIEARKAIMNHEPLNENEDEQEGRNGGNKGNGNGGNEGNGNGGNEGNGNGGNGGNGNGDSLWFIFLYLDWDGVRWLLSVVDSPWGYGVVLGGVSGVCVAGTVTVLKRASADRRRDGVTGWGLELRNLDGNGNYGIVDSLELESDRRWRLDSGLRMLQLGGLIQLCSTAHLRVGLWLLLYTLGARLSLCAVPLLGLRRNRRTVKANGLMVGGVSGIVVDVGDRA
ncbi:hypothetical protein Tco_0340982 [Tanacetum coccineum]